MRPQFGIGAVHRRLDQRRVGDRPRHLPRLVAVMRASCTVTAISLVAPSPPRTMPRASSRDTVEQRFEQRRIRLLVDRHAAGAGGHREQRVVGRALAIDGDGVERVARRFAAAPAAAAPAGRRRRSSGSRASSPCSARSCPSPWPCRRPMNVPAAGLHRDGVLLRKRVGRHDGARRVAALAARQRGHGRLNAGDHLVHLQVDADHAGRGDQHLLRRCSRAPAATSAAMRSASAMPCVAGAGVGAAAVHDDRARDARCCARDDASRRAPARPARGWS